MVALVSQMLEIRFWPSGQRRIREELVRVLRCLHKHLSHAKTDQEKRIITQEIESTDRQIDSLVYGLYGLNADEIRVVEEAIVK
jgi:hypothetical protein